jgi:putative aldouronate transport system permease protein
MEHNINFGKNIKVNKIRKVRFSLKESTQNKIKQNIPLWIIFFPVALYFIIFKYWPMHALIIAFKSYNFRDGILGSPWVGWKNFQLLFSSTQTVNIIRNTFFISIMQIIVNFPFPIIIAILLNEVKNSAYRRTVQTMIYLPHFFSWVVISGVIVSLFSTQGGLINQLIMKIGGTPQEFLYRPVSWYLIYFGSSVWKEMGYGSIVYLAALTQIDSSIYEASEIDGANKWKQTLYITLPGLAPTIVIMLILSLRGVLEVGFDQIYNLQNPVVSDISQVISTYIYQVGVKEGQFSMTTAMGLFESIISFILVISVNTVARKFDRQLW